MFDFALIFSITAQKIIILPRVLRLGEQLLPCPPEKYGYGHCLGRGIIFWRNGKIIENGHFFYEKALITNANFGVATREN